MAETAPSQFPLHRRGGKTAKATTGSPVHDGDEGLSFFYTMAYMCVKMRDFFLNASSVDFYRYSSFRTFQR